MQAIELIRWAMQLTDEGTARLVADLRDSPLTPSTPGGNHAIWLLGHLAFIESDIPRTLFGEPNRMAHWAPLFAPGTTPQADANLYPSFDEVLNTYRDSRKRNLKLLDEIGESG